LATKHLQRRHSSTPNIDGLCLHAHFAENLWRHVLECSCKRGRLVFDVCAPAEICDLQRAVRRAKQVLWLHIPVQDAEMVQIPQAQEQLPYPGDGIVLLQPITRHAICESEQIAGAQLHFNVHVVVVLRNIYKPHNMSTTTVLLATSHCFDLRFNLRLDASHGEIGPVHNLHGTGLSCRTV
jgi:hypothetical protein